jgi:hypothetical protein
VLAGIERPAVEPAHALESEPAAGGHGAKQLLRRFQHAGEYLPRQQPDPVREHVEDQPHQEPRHPLRVVTAGAQVAREACQGQRPLGSDLLARQVRLQPLGI